MTRTIICHRLNVNTGGARYSKELMKRVKYDQVIECKMKLPAFIDYFFVIPLMTLLAKKTDVCHISFNPCGMAAPIAKLKGERVVITVHDINPVLRNMWHPVWILNWFGITFADRIIVDTKIVKRDLIHHFDCKPDKIDVIPLGIGEEFKPMEPEYKSEIFWVGYIGGYKKEKNVQFLIDAFTYLKKYPNIRLMLGGYNGKMLPINVTTRPIVTDEELPQFYNNLDLFVFPSKWEGFGFPILEAQRCGVPVVVLKDAPHVPKEVTKWCYKVSSPKKLAKFIRFLDKNRHTEPDEYRKYAEGFTWEECTRKTEELL